MDRRTFLYKSLVGGGIAGTAIANILVFKAARNKRLEPGFPQNVDEDVCALAFSLNGTRLVSAATDDKLSIWDPITGQRIITAAISQTGQTDGVSFLGDDSWLATITQYRTVRLWNPLDLTEKSTLAFDVAPSCVAFKSTFLSGFTPPACLAAIALVDHSVRIVHNSEYVRQLMSSSGRRPVDISSGFMEAAVLNGHNGKVNAVAFSYDDLLAATASDDRTIRIWSTSNYREIKTLRGHRGAVNSVSFSKNGRLLASGSSDGKILIWDRQRMALMAVLDGHTDSVLNTIFLADSNWLASISMDKSMRLWSLKRGFSEVLQFPGNLGKYPAIDISSDGQYLASSWGKDVRFWKTSVLKDEAERKLSNS